ncbi:TonB-dependent receptor plug domain-containing protein [Hyunsoonleella pacifica]|uniref:TonB-dependent receptor n=1 Tax=Hyunsoonleella pacifica TaxID=1080224 RepID=A0A4Q9FW34_9FLAO|nr:TonB-dependent receptor plug domain-containing protein [Hyunsoonleella pacifica]TBN18805.1 TonB-dependent receptor [Hyunsoonleella pacifica]GGD04877.1 TonB-dependent receptor [Hyunsoonleella pacifica]
MILNKKYLTIYFSFFLVGYSFSQETSRKDGDSIKVETLEEVVLTGQYNPQSIKKSVFEVNVINRKQIDMLAGNNLADVLNQSLNLNIIPNANTGKSTVQMFGLDGQYFKILVDNIPLVNDEGLGNNTDLTQINLDDIKQIEIVEGSMGVQYGANAVSGVINIITKKNSKYKWDVSTFTQEETVSNEYALFSEGRHIQSLRIGHQLTDKINVSANYNRNDFNGFLDDRQGPYYELNDGLRGFLWLPKIQNTGKALINFSGDNFQSFYKFEYFDEQIDRFSSQVTENFNASTNTTNPVGTDAIFNSIRFFHHLNFSGKLKQQINYDVSFSYQSQKRDVEMFKYRIRTREKFDVNAFEFQSRNVWYSRGNFSNFFNSKNFKTQLGYEINNTNGFVSQEAGSFDGENIRRELGNYDVFASSEINITPKISIRPGARLIASTLFKPRTAVSLISKYNLKNDLELRVLVGSSPRLPNYAELYTYFVDANHDVRGNADLLPEQGASIFAHIKKKFSFGKAETPIRLQSKLSFNYLNVEDRIELSIINNNPLQFQYINIDAFKTIGAFFRNTLIYNSLRASFGLGYSGQSKVLDSRTLANDDYLFALQANANASYRFDKIGLVASAFFKFNGPVQQFVQQQDANNQTILVRGEQAGFSMLDASFRKDFANKALQLTLGARNLFNITQVNTTAIEGGAHSGPASNILLGYGRSYFLKLLYNIKSN